MSLTSDIWLNKEKVSTHLLQPALQLKIVEEHSIYIQAGVQKEERRGIYLHDLNILSPVQELKKTKTKTKTLGGEKARACNISGEHSPLTMEEAAHLRRIDIAYRNRFLKEYALGLKCI